MDDDVRRHRDFSSVKSRQDRLERKYVEVARRERNAYFARPYVDSHVRTTIHRLREAYLQLYQVEDDSPDRDWLKEVAESLELFGTTFPTRSRVLPLGSAAISLKSFVQYPVILWLLTFTGVGSWIAENAGFCACHFVSFATIISIGWIALSMVGGFRDKRKAFLRNEIYGEEAVLVEAVGAEPYPERQMDVYGFALMGLVFLIAMTFDRILGFPQVFGIDRATVWGFLSAVSLLASVVTAIASLRRDWAWGRKPTATGRAEGA